MKIAYHHIESSRMETIWRKTDETTEEELYDYWKGPSSRGWHTTRISEIYMLRPSPNHGAPRLYNGDDDKSCHCIYNYLNHLSSIGVCS